MTLGTALRCHALGVQSLWFDELFSLGAASHHTVRDVILKGAGEDQHPPGYPLLIHALTRTGEMSEWLMRLPSALAGACSVAIMYGLGVRLHSARVGLVASGLAAVHWFSIYYSQEGRPYALLLLGTSVCALLTAEIAHRLRARRRTWPLFVALTSTGIATSYLHYYGVLFMVLLGLPLFVLGLRRRLPLWPFVTAFGMMAVGYIPWLGVVWAQAGRRDGWMRDASLRAIGKVFDALASGHPYVLLSILCAGVLIALSSARRTARDMPTASDDALLSTRALVHVLLYWLLAPLAIQVVVTLSGIPVFSVRNLIISLPAVLLGAALALDTIDLRLCRGWPLASLALVALLLLDLVARRDYFTQPTKEPFRDVAQRLIAEGGKDAQIYVEPHFIAARINLYLELLGSPVRARPREALATLAPTNDQLWLVCRGCTSESVPGYKELSSSEYHASPIDLWRPKVFRVVQLQKE